nr:magnesium transporter [Alphaproteobacteria bacterium]
MDKHLLSHEQAETCIVQIKELLTALPSQAGVHNRGASASKDGAFSPTEIVAYLTRMIVPLHPADVASIISALVPALRVRLVTNVWLDPEVYTYLDDVLRDELLELHDVVALAGVMRTLDSDDIIDLIEDLDTASQQQLIAHLPDEAKDFVTTGLAFQENTAGRLMRRELVAIPHNWTVGEIIDHLRLRHREFPEQFSIIYLVDGNFSLIASVATARLLLTPRKVLARDISTPPRPFSPEQDEEEVAKTFRKYGLIEAPVVDGFGRLLGTLTLDDILEVTYEAAADDLLNISGVGSDDLYADLLATTKSRFSWLFVNLLTAFLAAATIGVFEKAIGEVVALAVLMPIAASMGGNAGTQSLAVSIRALATSHLSRSQRRRMVIKETLVGSLNGTAFALLTGSVAGFWFQSPLIGGLIAVALLITMIIAGCIGTVLPLVLTRHGIDPATASPIIL